MKLLTAEDEAKFYQYVPAHTRSSKKNITTNPHPVQQSKTAQSGVSSA
jgi:hypothetical protein